MGKRLISEIPLVRQRAEELDDALQALPLSYRPSWKIAVELGRDAGSSQLQKAAFSQPLCTAVQVILIDLLRAAGIAFSAVIGHSSGEIAAAYAAGFLTAADAVKVAYLRGFFAPLARGPNGENGAMLAAGTSMEDADELCDLPDFKGRLVVAASNSAASVTLSGNADAVEHARIVFGDEKKFARLLKVDTAYHSHHMKPCASPYVQALEEAGVKVQSPPGDCVWYSSVLDGANMEASAVLGGEYWRDNMVNTVLFSQAVSSAAQNSGPFHVALEVGPHPALKGPASQTLQDIGVELPYFGTLSRGKDDIEAISDSLGSLWTRLGASSVDLDAFQGLLLSDKRPQLLKNLPVYGWDHDKPYWYESRKSRLFRSRARPSHEILGVRCDEGNENELRWRNFLSVQEVPWLEGHKVQNQTVFPAAGYVSMGLEAAMVMAGDREVQLLEVEHLTIGKAIMFQDERAAVETMVTLSNVSFEGNAKEGSERMSADLSVSAHLSHDQNSLTKVAGCRVSAIFGPSSGDIPLPPSERPAKPSHLIDVDADKFYTALHDGGYGYTGPFRCLSRLQRRHNFCTGTVEKPATPTGNTPLLVHPALLDPAFQSVLGGYFWPGDGRLWSLFLPTSIRKVTVNPRLCRQSNPHAAEELPFDAWLADSPVREIRGDVVVYTKDPAEQPCIEVEGLSMISFADAAPSEDRPFFAKTLWGVSVPDGQLAAGRERASDYESQLAVACERVACYYWRRLDESLTPDQREICEPHQKQLLKTIEHVFGQVVAGEHPYVRSQWLKDDEHTIAQIVER